MADQHINGYNQLSQALRNKIKPLGRNEQAIYQVRGLKTGRAVSTTEEGFDTVEELPMYPSSYIPATCVINDPEIGEIPIGYVSGYAPAPVGASNSAPTPIFGDDRLGCIKFSSGNNSMVVLTSADRAKYEFMELCDWNENSVNPNKRKPDAGYLFRRIFLAKEATKEVLDEVEMAKTIALATKMTEEELRFSAPFLGINSTLSQDEMLVQFFKQIRKDWKKVRDVFQDEITSLTQLVGKAQSKNWLIYDERAGEWKRGDTMDTLAVVPAGSEPTMAIIEYLQKNTRGIALRQSLEKRLRMPAPAQKGKVKSKSAVNPISNRDGDDSNLDSNYDDDLVTDDDLDNEEEEDTRGPGSDMDRKENLSQL